MKSKGSANAHGLVRIAVAAGLACAASGAIAAVDTDAVEARARETWKESIAHTSAPGRGCFHAAYPSTLWVQEECFVAPRYHMEPPSIRFDLAKGSWQVVGDNNDYVVRTPHNMSQAVGSFPQTANVKFERSVGTLHFGSGGGQLLGPNEYSLQLNSNIDLPSAACQGHAGCTIWQQYLYATDFPSKGSAGVFIEYWLIGWGSSDCPTGWSPVDYAGGSCVINSDYTKAPDEPITRIGNEKLSGSAVQGGNDTVVFTDGSTAWSLSASDSVLDLATNWKESEFNVVGNANGSRADFNPGASLTVKIAVTDGSTAAPKCVGGAGTTGESNNLTAGTCSATGGTTPYIVFTESNKKS